MAPPWLESFRSMYRQGVPAKEVVEAMPPEAVPEEGQIMVVEAVFHDPVTRKYPPHSKYAYQVIKKIVAAIESQGEAISDELMDEFLEHQPRGEEVSHQMACTGRTLVPYYRCYEIPGAPDVLPIKVWPEFSQVGLALWPAGFCLAEYCLAKANELEGANVVELGSGVGLTGIVLKHATRAERIVMTDYLDTVNSNARENMVLCGAEGVVVDALDWEKVEKGQADVMEKIAGYDTTHLLAADVVYDQGVIPALADTVRAFLRLSPRLRAVVFAVTMRNEATFQMLREELDRCGVSLTLAPVPPPYHGFHYQRTGVNLYTLSDTLHHQ